jgi:hypothetical protein
MRIDSGGKCFGWMGILPPCRAERKRKRKETLLPRIYLI